jgi:6-phosphogluconolactonase (cycloisomerase 2 family)
VTLFRVDRHSGKLDFTGQYLPVGSPNMVAFAPG